MSPLSPDLTAALEFFLGNLLAWSLQLALIAWAAAVLALVLPLQRPVPRLGLWQSLLALGLVLPLLQPWRVTVAGVSSSLGFGSTPFTPLAAAPGAGQDVVTGFPWALAVAFALLGGVTLQLGRLGIGLWRVHRIRVAARPMAPPAWLDHLRSQVAPAVRFVISDQCGGPATFGVLRPTIVLPPAFGGMPVERQRAVALHELLHARRRDWLVLVGEELVRALLFFHPAVHWLVERIRLAREQCVDAEAVRRLGGRRAYLESLVEVARFSASAQAVPAAPFLRERHLRERVELLLKEVPMSPVRSLAHVGVTAGALVLAGALAVAAFPLLGPATSEADPAAAAAEQAAAPEQKPFPAKLVHRVQPTYPKSAKEEGVQGIFLIKVKIDEKGQIADARVAVSTPSTEYDEDLLERQGTPDALQGDERLGRAALEAVRQWRYEPVLDEDGKPTAVEAVLTVAFKLT